jgi:Immunity protein 7
MFEFHGWATLRVDTSDDPDVPVQTAREDAAMERVRALIRAADDDFSFFDLRRTGNGLIVLNAHGLRNHRYERAIDLFRGMASMLPDSYGLLYVHDDEDSSRGGDFTNAFRVWRMARGELIEVADSFLSPYVPTVELPWEEP